MTDLVTTDSAVAEYDAEGAARFLGINRKTLMARVRAGQLPARKDSSGYVFSQQALEQYRQEHRIGGHNKITTLEQQGRSFNRRYGEGAYGRLANLFLDPLATDEKIAETFGVNTLSIYRWYKIIFPDRETRRSVRAEVAGRKRVLNNDLFLAFYTAAREYFQRQDIEPIREEQRSFEFKKTAAMLKSKKVALREATETKRGGKTYYRLHRPRVHSDFVFYRLPAKSGDYPLNYLFMPMSVLPRELYFADSETSPYKRFKNNFGAWDGSGSVPPLP